MRIKCSRCGNDCSSEINQDDVIVRAFIECPECVENTPVDRRINALDQQCFERLQVLANTTASWQSDRIERANKLVIEMLKSIGCNKTAGAFEEILI